MQGFNLRFNLVYVFAILVVVLLWNMNLQYKKETVVFYGFAENKETEINLEQAVHINKIFVTIGQKVAANQALIEVSQNKLPLKLNELAFESEEIRVKRSEWENDIVAAMNTLKTKKIAKTSEIHAEIAQIKAKVAHNRNLVKDLENIDENKNGNYSQQTAAKIASLEAELEAALKPIDTEIANLQKKLNSNNPYNIQLQKVQSEQNFYEDKGRQLSINAPSNGLVGNIHCKEAENIPAFQTLITFYEENPTLVKGYVYENAVIKVSIGDTLSVSSSLHADYKCQGVVVGLGSRIVEIPVRLRKFAEVASYGREVLIQIPSDNQFLQKEKVVLKLNTEVASNNIFHFILNPSK
jgi:multidrug resistance efflux pump